MTGIRFVAAAAISASAAFTPANAEFFGCYTPKDCDYNGTPWSYNVTARHSYASASRPHSYRTQW